VVQAGASSDDLDRLRHDSAGRSHAILHVCGGVVMLSVRVSVCLSVCRSMVVGGPSWSER